jgi:hypothetical protein
MWWEYVIAAAALILLVYMLAVITGFQTRWLSRRTGRTAESMYGEFADSKREQRRFARKHGGQWTDDGQS